MARALGVSELAIGIALVAVGTSLPELATSVVSSLRKESDICVSTVVGSNIFNTLPIVGAVWLLTPLDVDRSLLRFELPVMLVFSLALVPLMKTGFVLTRFEGAVLLAAYVGFFVVMF